MATGPARDEVAGIPRTSRPADEQFTKWPFDAEVRDSWISDGGMPPPNANKDRRSLDVDSERPRDLHVAQEPCPASSPGLGVSVRDAEATSGDLTEARHNRRHGQRGCRAVLLPRGLSWGVRGAVARSTATSIEREQRRIGVTEDGAAGGRRGVGLISEENRTAAQARTGRYDSVEDQPGGGQVRLGGAELLAPLGHVGPAPLGGSGYLFLKLRPKAARPARESGQGDDQAEAVP